MTEVTKIRQVTPGWFEVVSQVMTEAAERAGLSPNHNVSLVERYTGGADLGGGLVQGLRFDIVGGKPSYRVGVRPDEHGAITVEITSAAARDVNRLRGDAVAAALERYLAFGKLRQMEIRHTSAHGSRQRKNRSSIAPADADTFATFR